MINDPDATSERPGASATLRPAIGRRLAVVATGAVLALGIGGVAYAATTDTPEPSASTTAPEQDGTTTPPDDTTITPDGGRGPAGGEPCEEGARTGGGTTSSSEAA